MPIEVISPPRKLSIPARYRDTIKLLFIAKHALGDGTRDSVDGDHAVYHREVRDVLEGMGLNVTAANSPEILFSKPDVDFVFSLLNRGGYLNSEMLMPTLCTRLGIPYLGATPIVRGLSDDKHLMKRLVRAVFRPPTAQSSAAMHPSTRLPRGKPIAMSSSPTPLRQAGGFRRRATGPGSKKPFVRSMRRGMMRLSNPSFRASMSSFRSSARARRSSCR
jgi:hypothetical protein